MDAKIAKPTKNTENTPERHNELSEEEMEPTIPNVAISLAAKHDDLKNIEAKLRFKQAEIHFERQHQELRNKLEEIKLIVRNQQITDNIADCLRTHDEEERRYIMERIIIVALAFLAAIGKLIGLF